MKKMQVNGDALSCRNKFFPIYDKLCLIYGEEFSAGRFSHSACSIDCNSDGTNLVMGMSLLLELKIHTRKFQ